MKQNMDTAWAEYCSHFPVTYMGRVVNEQRRADFEAGFTACEKLRQPIEELKKRRNELLCPDNELLRGFS